MTPIVPLQAGEVVPEEGFYMIFEFNPVDASLIKVGDCYAVKPYNRREALEAAESAALRRAARREPHQYLVALVTPHGGFRPLQ